MKTTLRPPSLMSSLMAGFDVVSNNIILILFSVLIDLVIWFGPHLRIARLLKPFLDQSALQAGIQDAGTLKLLQQGAEQLNLLVALRAFPVGIPSLMVGRLPTETPIDLQPIVIDIPSFSRIVGIWGLLIIAGTALGTFYFSMVAQASILHHLNIKKALVIWPYNFVQVLLLTGLMYGLIALVYVPVICLFSGLMLLGVGVNQLPLIVVLFIGGTILWILMPLFFSPHGIFAFGRSMWQSTIQSVRLSRATFFATAMFILVIVLLNEGLNVVWNLPKDNSWFMLVGIAGHAFITAGLLAATFIYYQDADAWLNELIQQRELNRVG